MTSEQCHLYWQSVVDTMAEGLFIVDTSGVVVFINQAAERITGYRRQEVLGRPCSIFESETCLVCTNQDGRLACRLFEDGRVTNRRCTVKRKDGQAVHLLKNATVLHDAHGQVIGGVETLTDISEVVDKDRQINGLRRELNRAYGFEGLLGESKAMAEVFDLLESAAQSQAPVVILGQSGTGKELAAAAIHRRSPRKDGPFIKVNCAALNPALLESELFGHEKGAFTGAERTRKGRFEAAHGGSLFLDEIGDLPPAVQVKLLRVLQEGEIERVGSQEPIRVDVRIISATNQDLAALMAQGKFRQDLYYRINVIPIRLPALHERPEDIPLLVQAFIERLSLRSGQPISGVSASALDRLMQYAWPGNVRELINAMEYAFVTCRQGEIQPQHLPASVLGPGGAPVRPSAPLSRPQASDEELRQEILEALRASGGHKAKAAELMGVSRVTFWKRLKRLGMED
ncbi:MAG: sigma 54-interacting transcriptional regulator [Desulfarculus sp.]|nr:sigma 54-interacting transcriptional regulator [Desulfarculus sp.]